jgi:hypothetical protein
MKNKYSAKTQERVDRVMKGKSKPKLRTLLRGKRDSEGEYTNFRGVFHPDSRVVTKKKPKLKESQGLRWRKKQRVQRNPKDWAFDKKTKTWQKKRKRAAAK